MRSTSPKPITTPAGLTEAALRQLVAGGLVTTLRVSRARDGLYVVFADMGTRKAQLLNSRGEPRSFSSLDTAAAAVLRLGAYEFITDLIAHKTK